MSAPIRSHADTPKNPSVAPRNRKSRGPELIACSGCDSRWTGTRACHCSGCHRTFTGLSAFDTHRVGSECKDPQSLLTEKGEPRLVPVEKQHWSGWATPGDDTRWSE